MKISLGFINMKIPVISPNYKNVAVRANSRNNHKEYKNYKNFKLVIN